MGNNNKLSTIFNQIDAHRRDLWKEHNLNDILLIGIISVIYGADSWNEMQQYGIEKEAFLKTFFQLNISLFSEVLIQKTK